MSASIVRLERKDLSRAATALGRAFHDDPLQSYVLPDPAVRAERSPAHFAPILEYGLRFGTVLTTAGEPRGAAVWLPPGETAVTDQRAMEAGLDTLPDVLGAAEADRFFSVLATIDPYHRSDVPAEHWYVLVIGVEPGAQGRGLGRALLTPLLEEARRDKLPCYLETAQPQNVEFYRHLGFRVLRDIVDPRSGLRLWTFRRDPEA
jgi:ribosomal protein S18 acetylase RimI-like enzyme